MSDLFLKQDIKKKIYPWTIVAGSLLYVLLPLDIIPDIPFLGWIDDFFILTSAILYLFEKQVGDISKSLRETIRLLRIISVGIGIIIILLLAIISSIFSKLFF